MCVKFYFPVDLKKNRGDSLHVKHLIEAGGNLFKKDNVITLPDNTLKSKLGYYYNLSLSILDNNTSRIYIRYSKGIFLLCLIHFLIGSRRELFFELNAVISDESKDSYRLLSLNYFVALLDDLFLKNKKYTKICVTPEIKANYGEGSILIENCVKIPDELEDLKKIKPDRNRLKLIFVGTFEPWQDLPVLIHSCKKLEDSGIKFDCKLIGDGSTLDDIKKLIQTLELEEHVTITGRLTHNRVLEEIAHSNIAIAPLKGSRLRKTGSSALKVFEYLLLNKYTLLTSCGSFSRKIESLGFGKEFKSSEDLFKCLKEFDSKPIEINSSEYIIANHSYLQKVNKLASILNNEKH